MRKYIKDIVETYAAYRVFKKLYKMQLVRKEYSFLEIYKAIKLKEELVKNENIESTESTI